MTGNSKQLPLLRIQRRLGEQAAGREPAVGHLQRHPGRSPRHRRPRPDTQAALSHACDDRTPPGDLRLGPGQAGGILGSGQAVERALELAYRNDGEAAIRGSSGIRYLNPTSRQPRSDLEAGLEPAPSRLEAGALPLSYSKTARHHCTAS